LSIGVTAACIGVAEVNHRAQRLYTRLGYTNTGIREISRYDYPDARGVLREIVEHDMLLVRRL
jgi:ribosomal protein S18 acetylase RimI-like enzyme